MSEGAPLLEARALRGGYLPNVDILNGCSLEVAPGEMVGIIGPNGAGKSTLLKAIFGLVRVREGTVLFQGATITNRKPHDLVGRGIGYVPQTNNVFPRLTVRENLEMGAYQDRADWDEKYAAVCELFPMLFMRAGQRAGSLSGGERQMVAMARALMARPSLLLLDEPSAGLSPLFQQQVFEKVVAINESGVSIVMVEQNARRCLALCRRGYVLDQGANAYTGTGDTLLQDERVEALYLGTLGRAR